MDVAHVAKLACLTLTSDERKQLNQQFSDTLRTVEVINELGTANVAPTSQVTGLNNITREDIIDSSRILPQSSVLKQAQSSHGGFVVVPPVLND